MSLKAEVVLTWGDGDYLFALKGGQIEELQHKCGDIGFGAIYQRVMLGQFYWGDLYHIARLGLIGGGMGAVEAKGKIDFYMGNEAGENRAPLARGPNSPVSLAQAILGATMQGMESGPPGEAKPGEARPKTRKKKSISPDTAPRSSGQESTRTQ